MRLPPSERRSLLPPLCSAPLLSTHRWSAQRSELAAQSISTHVRIWRPVACEPDANSIASLSLCVVFMRCVNLSCDGNCRRQRALKRAQRQGVVSVQATTAHHHTHALSHSYLFGVRLRVRCHACARVTTSVSCCHSCECQHFMFPLCEITAVDTSPSRSAVARLLVSLMRTQCTPSAPSFSSCNLCNVGISHQVAFCQRIARASTHTHTCTRAQGGQRDGAPTLDRCLHRAGKGSEQELCGIHARVVEIKGVLPHGTVLAAKARGPMPGSQGA